MRRPTVIALRHGQLIVAAGCLRQPAPVWLKMNKFRSQRTIGPPQVMATRAMRDEAEIF
jgi:hypothetical protein